MILDIASTCNDSALAVILPIARRVLTFIQIIGPILCIISLTISFVNLIINPEEKKEPNKIKNKIIALVLLFFIPTIVNAVMGILDDSTEFSRCWRHGGAIVNDGNNSIVTDPNSKTKVNPSAYNQSDYEKGVPQEKSDNKESSNSTKSSIVYIGDSRVAQAYAYLSGDWNAPDLSKGGVHDYDGTKFIGESSMGLDWLKSAAISKAEPYFKSGTSVVISLGVNDLYNADNYISYINDNVGTWTKNGSKVYVTTVGPCNGSYSNLNNDISTFNSKIKSGLSSKVKVIDINSFLISEGYSTTDGLHYNKETYDAIYNYIKSNV